MTTVGYGYIHHHSTSGRIIGITITLVGIGFVALLTAFIADRFISNQPRDGGERGSDPGPENDS